MGGGSEVLAGTKCKGCIQDSFFGTRAGWEMIIIDLGIKQILYHELAIPVCDE